MIGKERFKAAMDEVEALIGQSISKDQRIVIFKRIVNYDEGDFMKACDDEEFLKMATRFKFNYPLLNEFIQKYQGLRQAAADKEQKRTNDLALQRLLKDEKTPAAVREFLRGFDKREIQNAKKDKAIGKQSLHHVE